MGWPRLMARIRIEVDGKLALTVAQVAAEFDLQPESTRTVIRRLGVEPVAHLDARTPLYAAVLLRKAMKARPGKGANLRKS